MSCTPTDRNQAIRRVRPSSKGHTEVITMRRPGARERLQDESGPSSAMVQRRSMSFPAYLNEELTPEVG
jgi:hypothetical protein